ncbi:MAG: glycosyltransferase family 2 protein [Candidatus Omnitrophota bacterium]
MRGQKLSIIVITKNAANKIKNCLESVKWADEIIVVDGGSADGTIEIVKKYTDKIITSEFDGFDKERNKGTEEASGDWILQMDADEVVPEDFKKRLLRLLEGEDEGCVSFKFRRRNIFLGRLMMRGGWYHYSAHLFKKGFAHYKGGIHEQLIVNGKQGKMEAGLEHYPFYSISEFIERQNRYTTLQANEMFAKNRDISKKEIMYNLKVKPIKLFWKMYIKKKGYKEKLHGFIFSVLFSWVHFVKWLKYWELRPDNKS